MSEARPSREAHEAHRTGHRRREVPGTDLGRIIMLSDAVFAFALTLLILGLAVPSFNQTGLNSGQASQKVWSALASDWTRFAGYIFAFVSVSAAQYFWFVPLVIGRFARRYGVD